MSVEHLFHLFQFVLTQYILILNLMYFNCLTSISVHLEVYVFVSVSKTKKKYGFCAVCIMTKPYQAAGGHINRRPMGHNSLICIFANAMQQFSSIVTGTGTQISPYHKKVKGHPSLIILTNSVDLESPMLYTQIQPQSFLNT